MFNNYTIVVALLNHLQCFFPILSSSIHSMTSQKSTKFKVSFLSLNLSQFQCRMNSSFSYLNLALQTALRTKSSYSWVNSNSVFQMPKFCTIPKLCTIPTLCWIYFWPFMFKSCSKIQVKLFTSCPEPKWSPSDLWLYLKVWSLPGTCFSLLKLLQLHKQSN